MLYHNLRTDVRVGEFTKGVYAMFKDEMELIRLIREHNDPTWAIEKVAEIILADLVQHGSSAVPLHAAGREFDGISQ